MTAVWTEFVSLLQVGIFGLSHVYGGSIGAAVICFALLGRVALLPITVRMTLRARAHAGRLRAIQPEILQIRATWSKDPKRMLDETARVYERHGVGVVEPGVLKSGLLQAPLLVGFYQAIRGVLASAGSTGFGWIANLARPSLLVAVIAALLAGTSAALGGVAGGVGPSQSISLMILVSMIFTLLLVMNVSAGVGLYFGATNLVGVLQSLLVRREEARMAAS